MNPKRLSLALAACTVWAGACLAFGDENATAVHVIYLKSSTPSTLPLAEGEVRGRLLEDLARQSFIVAARDQLGLRTRDASLGDDVFSGGDNIPFEVLAEFKDHSCLGVRRGVASPPETLLHETLRVATASEPIAKNRYFASIDYRAVLTELEELSRGRFVDVIKRAGFAGKPHACKGSADIPQAIDQFLRKMDFISQFSAVRELHELIRVDGESPERLGALVRGYANLGMLPEFHWHPATKALKARSPVYAQRLFSCGTKPWSQD